MSKPRPSETMLARLQRHPIDGKFLSSVTVGEIRYGIELLPQSRRRDELTEWFARLQQDFANRVLAFDSPTAELWGLLAAEARMAGRVVDTADLQIAATALRHGLTLWTRNTKDFAGTRVATVNPWE